MSDKQSTPDNHLKTEDIRANVQVQVERTMRSKRLEDYPLLVFATLCESHGHPKFGRTKEVSHEHALRTEDKGILVSDIVAAAGGAHEPDPETLAAFVAARSHLVETHGRVALHKRGPEEFHDARGDLIFGSKTLAASPVAIAERFGTTVEHVEQALAYVAEHGPDA